VPFLRFAKDRRGYESTYLLDARRAGERDAPLLLYWFRTPPHVKMGRAALDEETIRVLEDTHPAVDFDWPRILATRPQPSEPPPDTSRPPRARTRGESRGEERRAPRTARQPPPPRELPPPTPSALRSDDLPGERAVEKTVAIDAPIQSAVQTPAPEPVVFEVADPDPPAVRKFTRIFDAPLVDTATGESAQAEPMSEVGRLSEPSASERALGSEQLERLRGRYAAVMARIARRISDPSVLDRLRVVAERANPDSWVTDEEVRAGMAGLNDVYAELVPFVGRRRRRRRSGGRPGADVGGGTADATSDTGAAIDAPLEDGEDGDDPDDEESPESGQ
jgi:hypothetical protein